MGYNISALPTYTDQTGAIISKSVLGAKSASLFTPMPDVKGSKSINIFDTALTFASDACSFSSNDTTTLTQRTLTVGAIKAEQSICPADFDGYYAQYFLKRGSWQTDLPFEQALLDYQAANVAALIETAIWVGDTSTGNTNANTNKFQGILPLISGSSSVVTGTTTGTSAGMVTVMQNVYNSIPAQLLNKDDVVIFAGFDTFRLYQQGLSNANLFHYDASIGANFEIFVPGTNVKVIAVNGLNNTSNKIVAGRLSNFYYGFDASEDSASAKIWYSQDNEQVRMSYKFKAGVQVAFLPEIVYYR